MNGMLDDILLPTKFNKHVSLISWYSARTIVCRIYTERGAIKYGRVQRDDILATDEEIAELIGEPLNGETADYIADTGLMDI